MRLPQGFEEYTDLQCDRLSFLQDYLAQKGVQTSVVPLNGRKHLYVNFPSTSYDPTFKIKTVITHYDRVPNSPGANDNSAANFCVADFAARLIARPNLTHNVRIFFTDGEELGEKGVFEQGAYKLAELFKKMGITHDDVYVFDACGRGTVPILARAGLEVKSNSAFKRQFNDLYSRTENLLRNVCTNSWMSLPVPYSDNAGFLACGIPAVAITFLPKEEAGLYYKNLMTDPNLEKAIMNCDIVSSGGTIQKFKYKEKMPMTWRMFHTIYDNVMSLSEESFPLLGQLLDEIASQRTLA